VPAAGGQLRATSERAFPRVQDRLARSETTVSGAMATTTTVVPMSAHGQLTTDRSPFAEAKADQEDQARP
jgi:hypothetical protein